MGRRVHVRWDLTIGPPDPDEVVLLPESARFTPGKLRATLCAIDRKQFSAIEDAMKDAVNWVSAFDHNFRYERSLSDYIGTFPNRLEEGMQKYPSMKVWEKVFDDGSRSDVLLVDRENRPVVVECKKPNPTVEDLQQLEGYMKHVEKLTKQKTRGYLVHGGSRILDPSVRQYLAKRPSIEVVRYRLDIDFSRCE